jgi:WD40 repeat protein
MSSHPTARLSRFLVRCHPRRWRQRYGDELLDVLDQHHVGARTTLDLAFSALDAHLDPAWRGRPTAAGLRRGARVAAPWAAALTALALVVGVPLGIQVWNDNHWTPGDRSGVTALAFSPDRRILVSAVGFDIDGTDTVWDIADPGRPRRLASFEGGAPTVISPDGRIVATINFDNQPVLWDVSDPARPARVATLPGDGVNVLWGQAFSPDGRTLAAAYSSRLYLWDVTNPARPRRLATLAFQAAAPPSWHGFPGDIAFSPDGHTLASTTSHDQVGLWNVATPTRPARIATLGGHTGPVAAFAFSSSGRLLADIGYDGRVAVFNLTSPPQPARTGTERTVAAPPTDSPGDYTGTSYALAFSADGHTLTAIADSAASASGPALARETVSRWRVTSAGAVTLIARVSDDSTPAGQLALAPSGHTLARGAPPGGATVNMSNLP